MSKVSEIVGRDEPVDDETAQYYHAVDAAVIVYFIRQNGGRMQVPVDAINAILKELGAGKVGIGHSNPDNKFLHLMLFDENTQVGDEVDVTH